MADRLRPVTTPDGRTLGVATWGDPSGLPVLALHGTPGSRLGRPPDEAALADAGVRLITYDRPGYGHSDRLRERRVVDCVPDVAAVLDALDIARTAVAGSSGGGPHALAVAARLADRVSAVQCVVGLAPFDAPGLDWMAGLDPENVKEVGWAQQGEEVLHRELARQAAEDLAHLDADPADLFPDWELGESDRRVLARSDIQQVFRRVLARGLPGSDVWGWVDDDLAFLRPWGFDLSEIAVPVSVHYGRQDVMVPAAHGDWLAANVPGATAVVEEGGHMGDPDTMIQRFAELAHAR